MANRTQPMGVSQFFQRNVSAFRAVPDDARATPRMMRQATVRCWAWAGRHGSPLAALAVGSAFAGGILVSVYGFGDPPASLPGVAIGSTEIYHLIRGGLIGAFLALGLLVLINGWRGQWPAEYGIGPASLKYLANTDEDLAGDVDALREVLEKKVDLTLATQMLEAQGKTAKDLDQAAARLRKLEKRVDDHLPGPGGAATS